MMAKRLGLGFALLALAPLGRAQKPAAIPLVPTANWQLAGSRTATVDAVREFGGDLAVEREYGVESLELRTYRLDSGTVNVVSEATPDSSTAFGLLTCYQTEQMTAVSNLPLAMISRDGGLMARGRYFFRILRSGETASKIPDDDVRALMFLLASSHPSRAPSASMPEALPSKGLVPGTEKYLLGEQAAKRVLPSFRTDLIGFSQGAEVLTGYYSQAGSGRALVLAITYPTPQIARARYGEMESTLGMNEDRGHGSMFGKRLGSFVIIVLNATSAKTARDLLMNLRCRVELWPTKLTRETNPSLFR